MNLLKLGLEERAKLFSVYKKLGDVWLSSNYEEDVKLSPIEISTLMTVMGYFCKDEVVKGDSVE